VRPGAGPHPAPTSAAATTTAGSNRRRGKTMAARL
jgi:hypothetical protein